MEQVHILNLFWSKDSRFQGLYRQTKPVSKYERFLPRLEAPSLCTFLLLFHCGALHGGGTTTELLYSRRTSMQSALQHVWQRTWIWVLRRVLTSTTNVYFREKNFSHSTNFSPDAETVGLARASESMPQTDRAFLSLGRGYVLASLLWTGFHVWHSAS